MSSRFEKFSEKARRVLSNAQLEAQRLNQDYIGTEHILLGIISETSCSANQILNTLNIDVNYYTKGKFLNTENYHSNPFSISYQLKKREAVKSPIMVNFSNGSAIISKVDVDSGTVLIPVNKWVSIDGLELKQHNQPNRFPPSATLLKTLKQPVFV